MDLLRALSVSASGLAAQRARMDVITENLANSESSVTSTGRPYQRKMVVLEAMDAQGFGGVLQGMGGAGVRVGRIIESRDPARRVYQPDHPQAGKDGFLNLPNVNPLQEMVEMMMSTRAYEANSAAFQATKSMGAKLLELLR